VGISRRRRLGRRISIFLRRFETDEDREIGVHVPSGTRIRGSHLAAVAVVLVGVGIVVLVSSARIHGRLIVVGSVWLGALLLLAIARDPRRWL
jgi:hypothetical protein